jgi:NADH-quinone oxidoreductase subunit K
MDSSPVNTTTLLALGAALFGIGLLGFLLRRNLLIMFLASELMLQGVIVTAVAFGRMHHNLAGQAFAIFVLVLAAVEAALGLGLAVVMFRRSGSLDAERWRSLGE